MAGDWIKMRNDLRDDPQVFKLATITKLDRFAVIGRLWAFWSWADRHAVDGHVDGGASTVVDDVVQHAGFADALAVVGWLQIGDGWIEIPKHDRHNGESAKERGLKNNRQARWRGKPVDGDVDATPSTKASTRTSTQASTREEKRREDIKPMVPSEPVGLTPDAASTGSAKPRVNGHRAPSTGRELAAQARDVLTFLNDKAGRAFPATDSNVGIIVARFREGFTPQQLRQVVAKKAREWKPDEKMAQYLRPETLFGRQKFSQYVGELVTVQEDIADAA